MSYKPQYKPQQKYIKKNVDRVVVNTSAEEKQKWQAAADSAGMPLATLIRKLMSDYMNK